MMDPNNLPSTPRQEYKDAQPLVQLIRDLLGGTPQMQKQRATYIRKWKAEKAETYALRATSAKVYGGLARSLSTSVGFLFAKAPVHSENWPAAMEEHWTNLDGKGTAGDVFAKRRAEDAIADGFGGILVDFPPVPEGKEISAEDELTLNLRPRWAPYQRLDILSWRTATINNVETPVRIVLRESLTRDKGEYGTETVPAYRILSLVALPPAVLGALPTYQAQWQLVEEVKGSNGQTTSIKVHGKGVFKDASGAAFDVIPLAIGYAGRTDAPFTAHPPLTDQAYCNLQHWQIATDKRWYERLCAYPQPKLKGDLAATGLNSVDGKPVAAEFKMGPGVVVKLKADADLSWLELAGESLQRLREAMEDERDELGELGAAFLRKRTKGVETAEAKRLDAVAENSTLATAAQGVEDWFNQALMFHARYLGIPAAQAPTLTINKDFEGVVMDAATMTAWATLARDLGLPVEVVLKALRDGGRLVATDDELAALALQMETNRLAAEEQQRQEQQAALDAAQAGAGAQPRKVAA